MERSPKYRIDHIVDSLINGQFKQAKEQTQYRCKTKPEKLARKVGQVIGALVDTDDYNRPELAARYLNVFDSD